MKSQVSCLLFFLIIANAVAQKGGRHQQELQLLADNVFSLSEVMLHDVANPPAAARFYAYSLLGAYEAILPMSAGIPVINNRLRTPLAITPATSTLGFDRTFCAIYAMLDVGRQIMPS